MCKEELKGFQDDWEDLAPCTDKHDSAEAFADSLHQRNVWRRKNHGSGGRAVHQAGNTELVRMPPILAQWHLSMKKIESEPSMEEAFMRQTFTSNKHHKENEGSCILPSTTASCKILVRTTKYYTVEGSLKV